MRRLFSKASPSPSTLAGVCILLWLSGCAAVEPTQMPVNSAVSYGHTASAVKTKSTGPFTDIERFLESGEYEARRSKPGVWRLSIDGVLVFLVSENARVRIIAPIFALHQLESEPTLQHALMIRLLQSNFERAVDARYAIFDGIVFATVTHPRSTLQEIDLGDFLDQVVNLHKNTFRTGRGAYGSGSPEPDSIEIDPRLDETLGSPEAFEKGIAIPKAPPRKSKKPTPRDSRLFL